MNNLETKKVVQTIPSYEVAEMMERRHSQILKMIEGGSREIGIIKVLTEHDFVLSDYFIKSTYKDASGKENKCYKCTRLGCDMLANKLTGEKGILFTAKYVKRFNEMQQYIEHQVPQISKEDQAILNIVNAKDKTETALAIKEYKDIITAPLDDEIKKLKPLAEKYGIFLDTEGLTTVEEFANDINIKKMGRNNMYKYLRDKEILKNGKKEGKKRGRDYHNYPYRRYIEQGWFVLRPSGYHMENGIQVVDYRTHITKKGIENLIKLLIEDGYLKEIA